MISCDMLLPYLQPAPEPEPHGTRILDRLPTWLNKTNVLIRPIRYNPYKTRGFMPVITPLLTCQTLV